MNEDTKQCIHCDNQVPIARVACVCDECLAKYEAHLKAKSDARNHPTITAKCASAWYQDCDPFFSMAFDPKRYPKGATRKFNALLRSDVRDAWRNEDSDETLTARLDSVRWSGMHVMDIELTSEQLADFKAQGYCYLETF